MYCLMMASIMTGSARCTTQTSGCGTSRMWLGARPRCRNRSNQWLLIALSAAPLPALVPRTPPWPTCSGGWVSARPSGSVVVCVCVCECVCVRVCGVGWDGDGVGWGESSSHAGKKGGRVVLYEDTPRASHTSSLRGMPASRLPFPTPPTPPHTHIPRSPGTPATPPSPLQMHSYAEMRSLMTMTASLASLLTSYPRDLISRALSAAVSQYLRRQAGGRLAPND